MPMVSGTSAGTALNLNCRRITTRPRGSRCCWDWRADGPCSGFISLPPSPEEAGKLHAANALLESRIQERTSELEEQRKPPADAGIDHLPDNVFVKDTQSRMVLNNQAHAQHLGGG